MSIPDKDAYPKAKEAVLKALELDNTLAEAHIELARIKQVFEWDWSGADKAFKRGIELKPSYNFAQAIMYANYLTSMDRFEESIAIGKQNLEINPVLPIAYNELGFALLLAGDYDAAIEYCWKGLEFDPNFPQSHWLLMVIYAGKGMYEETIEQCQKLSSLAPDSMTFMAEVGCYYGIAGRRAEALKILNEFKEKSKKEYIRSYLIAIIYAGLGEQDQAIEWLEKAYDEHDHSMVWLKVGPQFDSLREDPRFQALLKKMKLE